MIAGLGSTNKLADQLAMMPDNMLPRMAQQYKQDAITLSLILGERNRRQRVRSAGQAQQGMQPQPKVNDQIVASMQPQQMQPQMPYNQEPAVMAAGGGYMSSQMPEDVGIGALPAPNMQFAAEGGILGYADGDLVASSEPVVMMAGGGHVPRYQGNPRDGSLVGGKTSWEEELERLQAPPQESSALGRGIVNAFTYSSDFEALVQSAKAKRAQGIPLTVPEARALQSEMAPTAPTAPTAAPAKKVTPTYSADDYSGMDRRIMAGSEPNIPSITPPKKAATKDDTGRREKTGIQQLPAATPTDPFSMESLRQARKDAGGDTDYEVGELRNQLVGMRSQLESQGEERLAARKKEIEEEGDVFKGRAQRIADREAGLKTQKSELGINALIEFGLSLASQRGPFGEAAGKAGTKTLASYGAGLKDLRAAQQKLEDARDNIEDLRMNRSDMNKREIRALEKDRDANLLKGQELMFSFAQNRLGVKEKDAAALFGAFVGGQEKKAEMANRVQTANITAAPALARNAMLKEAQGDTAKVRSEYGKLQAKVMDNLTKDANYQTAQPAQQQLMYTTALRNALATNPFLASYASGIGFSSAPTGGKVYDLTED